MQEFLNVAPNESSVSPAVSPATFRRLKPIPLRLNQPSDSLPAEVQNNNSSKEYALKSDQDPKQNKHIHHHRIFNNESISQDSKIKVNKEDLDILGTLGYGAGGNVTRVSHRPTGLILARKVIPGAYGDANEAHQSEKRLMREIRLMKNCKSSFIVSFFGASLDDGDVILLMEYLDLGSLDSIYRKHGPLNENSLRFVAIATLNGLDYLNDMNVVHRDIKPSNILVNSLGEIKIADFGISKDNSSTTGDNTFTGTQGYLAPERITNVGNITIVSDVWSFGLSIIELATGLFPYDSAEGNSLGIMELYQMIVEDASPSLSKDKFSPEIIQMVSNCLIKQVEARKTPKELLESEFCQNELGKNHNLLMEWITAISSKSQKK